MSLTIYWAKPNNVAWSFGGETHYSPRSRVLAALDRVKDSPRGTAILSRQPLDESTLISLHAAMLKAADTHDDDSEPTWTEQTREDRRECQAGW